MPVEYRKFILREHLRKEPEKLFVFGDNLERKGFGGQAKEMRGEPNAVGIPTKRKPTMNPDAFFNDSPEDYREWSNHSFKDLNKLWSHSLHGGTIVWPEAGIGTGRAKLKETSPTYIWETLEYQREVLDGTREDISGNA